MKVLIGILFSIILGFLLLFSMPYIDDYLRATEFNSEKWNNSSNDQRWDMRRDLLKKDNLIGKTKKDIIDILGIPDREGRDMIHYDLGPAIIGIDMGRLEIEFVRDTVVSCSVWSG
ncbi:hypothetical protein N9B82_01165 [Saprospiraceae bacterium]|nr:hypothetical protein [Saprospiraceae bacterium]